jgi:hypothetical protein
MKRRIPALAIVIAVTVTAAGAGLLIAVDQASKSAPTKTGTATSVAIFINSLKQANSTPFIATYGLNGYLLFQNGTIVIAQLPSPPGTKVKTNADGYSGTGRYAYIFRGSLDESSSGSRSTPM